MRIALVLTAVISVLLDWRRLGQRAGRRLQDGSRIGGTGVLVAALLWVGSGAAAAQEPPKLDAFAGGGLGRPRLAVDPSATPDGR